MASGGEDGGNNREIEPEEEELAVVRDTEGVFRHFMFQRYQDETERGEQSGEMNTSSVTARPDALEELRSCNDVHGFSQNVPVIGQRLGEIGDEIDAKYKDQFKDMIDSLSLTPATAYETFAAVARRLFRSGINWGRIVALLCFGYEIAVTVIRRGFSGNFLRRIIRFVVDFIFNERIARWIAQHGGWRGVLDFRLSEPSWYTIGIVLLFGTLFAFFAMKKTGT
ncbi:bcl-2 homologous antagonist/killer-like [Montipora foliosa]|uniref:bcl-2 homologous antagonist/killer-like n=1 Tax=Montipora foliosa TaxID=591990 RepID=UPI0035F1B574